MNTLKSLVVLDHALRTGGPDPHRIIRDIHWPDLRNKFSNFIYFYDFEKAVEWCQKEPYKTVLVVGPTFLRDFTGGKEAFKSMLTQIKFPLERVIFVLLGERDFSVYEHLGREGNLLELILGANRDNL